MKLSQLRVESIAALVLLGSSELSLLQLSTNAEVGNWDTEKGTVSVPCFYGDTIDQTPNADSSGIEHITLNQDQYDRWMEGMQRTPRESQDVFRSIASQATPAVNANYVFGMTNAQYDQVISEPESIRTQNTNGGGTVTHTDESIGDFRAGNSGGSQTQNLSNES